VEAMSKRFGRQQKRKLKSEIEAFSIDNKRLKYRNSEDVATVKAAKYIVSTVAKVNRNHPSLELAFIDRSMYQLAMNSFSPLAACVPCGGTIGSDIVVDIRRIDLYDFESAIQIDEIERSVIFKTKVDSSRTGKTLTRWNYKVSEMFMKQAPKDYIIDMVSRQMADLMCHDMEMKDAE
jgi:hypothetical protein